VEVCVVTTVVISFRVAFYVLNLLLVALSYLVVVGVFKLCIILCPIFSTRVAFYVLNLLFVALSYIVAVGIIKVSEVKSNICSFRVVCYVVWTTDENVPNNNSEVLFRASTDRAATFGDKINLVILMIQIQLMQK
jgi:hypothetical protein